MLMLTSVTDRILKYEINTSWNGGSQFFGSFFEFSSRMLSLFAVQLSACSTFRGV